MALSAERTFYKSGACVIPGLLSMGVKASTKILRGALVVNNAGVADKGQASTTLVALGVAAETADNTSGGANAINVSIVSGVFDFANSAGGDEIAATEIGKNVYIVDDDTVAKTDGTSTRSIAGKLVKIEGGRPYVLIGIGV